MTRATNDSAIKNRRVGCCRTGAKIGQRPRGRAPSFHEGFRHAFRCATKCLGIDAIKLRPSIVAIPAPTLVTEWKALADHLADVLAHPGKVFWALPEGRFRQRLVTNRSFRSLLAWCSCRQGGYFRRALRVVATFLQLKRAFPPLPLELEVSALEKHKSVLSRPIAPFSTYDIVDDIIQTHFKQGWANHRPWKASNLPTLKNRAILDGHTARNPAGLAPGCYPRIGRSSVRPMAVYHAERAYDRMYQMALAEEASRRVQAVPVPDAGKFRVITKSHRALKVLEPVQAQLHSHLKRNHVFRYTAEEAEPDRLERDLQRMMVCPGKFLSVDYSNATDAVDASFHEPLVRRILEISGSFELECLAEIAGREMRSDGRTISYPDGSTIRQRRGSLMGSLLSFPVLCLWNESILRRSGYDGIDHSVTLINGDDAIKKCTLSDALSWAEYASRLGLERSPGKVLWSNRLMSFCSRYFTVNKGRVCRVDHVPVSRMLSPISGSEFNRIPDRYKPHYKRWCKMDKRELRPLCAPVCVGGLGGSGLRLTAAEKHLLGRYNQRMSDVRVPLLVARALGLHDDESMGSDTSLSWIRSSKAFEPVKVSYPPRPRKRDQPIQRLRCLSNIAKTDLSAYAVYGQVPKQAVLGIRGVWPSLC
nr:RNA-dependent RNA polymerase [Riboviria sp.]